MENKGVYILFKLRDLMWEHKMLDRNSAAKLPGIFHLLPCLMIKNSFQKRSCHPDMGQVCIQLAVQYQTKLTHQDWQRNVNMRMLLVSCITDSGYWCGEFCYKTEKRGKFDYEWIAHQRSTTVCSWFGHQKDDKHLPFLLRFKNI